MELNFLGAGAAFNPAMDNTNAFFTEGGIFYLIDCGETTFGKIWNLPELRRSGSVTVVVTHLHCDHVGSLASLISYCYYVLKKPVRVLHPLDTVVRLLDLMGIERRCYEYSAGLSGAEGVGFEAVEVDHVDNMTCFGYVVDLPSGKLFYSGDAVEVPASVLDRFLTGEIGRMYIDTSLAESDHPTHGTLSNLERTVPPEHRGRVYCMHLDSDFRSVIRRKGFGTIEVFAASSRS